MCLGISDCLLIKIAQHRPLKLWIVILFLDVVSGKDLVVLSRIGRMSSNLIEELLTSQATLDWTLRLIALKKVEPIPNVG